MKRTLSFSLILVLILSATLVLAATSNWWEVGPGSASGGGISNNDGRSRYPSLVLDSADYPVVAWSDDTTSEWQIYIRRWDGSAWVEVGAGSASGGGISNDSERSVNPTVVVDSMDNPIVGWSNNLSSSGHIKRWDGSAWIDLCSGQTCFRLGGDSLAIDEDDNLVAFCGKEDNEWAIVVRRWDGSVWTQLEGLEFSTEGSSTDAHLALAMSDAGAPFVAWVHDIYGASGGKIYLKQWNGVGWVELGGSASGEGVANVGDMYGGPDLAIDSLGKPVVAWVGENRILHAKSWTGSAWVEYGSGWGGSHILKPVDYPSLALDSLDSPIVAYMGVDYRGTIADAEIMVVRWNGSAWGDMGEGSSSDGGISDNIKVSTYPSLAVTVDDRAFVAWHDYYEWPTITDFQIFVKMSGFNVYLPITLRER